MNSKYFIRRVGKDNVLYKVDSEVNIFHEVSGLAPHLKKIWRKSNEFATPQKFYEWAKPYSPVKSLKQITEEEAFEWVMLNS